MPVLFRAGLIHLYSAQAAQLVVPLHQGLGLAVSPVVPLHQDLVQEQA